MISSLRFLTGIVKPERQGVFFFWWLWWTFVAPFLMIAVFIGSLVTSFTEPLEYVRYSNVSHLEPIQSSYMISVSQYEENDHEPYPGWAHLVGALLVISEMIAIPLIFIVRLIWKKDERKATIDWFINFPTRCHEAWRDFKQLCSSAKNYFKKRSVGDRIRIAYHRCFHHRSWSPEPSPYINMQLDSNVD